MRDTAERCHEGNANERILNLRVQEVKTTCHIALRCDTSSGAPRRETAKGMQPWHAVASVSLSRIASTLA